MFFYEGYTCPVCKREFKETDDIVACPKCGAPHHRECWKLEGHCHYAEDHDTPRQWKRPEEAAPVASDPAGPAAPSHPTGKICPHCGQQNTEFAEFCSRCGQELPASDWTSAPPSGGNPYQAPPSQPPYGGQAPYGSAQPPYGQQVPPYGRPGGYGEYTPFRMPVFDPYGGVPHEETIEDVSAEDLVTFTGSNSAYYLPKFYKMSRGGSKCVWNWASFFLTPYWLLYRKNFLSGILVLLFYIGKTIVNGFILYGTIIPSIADASGSYTIGALQNALMSGDFTIYVWILFLGSIADLLIRLLFGLMGNYLYLRTAVSRIKKLRQKNSGNYRQNLMAAGGISFMFGAVSYAVLTFANLIVNFFYI